MKKRRSTADKIINGDIPVTPEAMQKVLAEYAAESIQIPGEVMAEVLADFKWLLVGRLPPRYKGRDKDNQGKLGPDIVELWRDARLYMDFCALGLIVDDKPAETVAEQFGVSERHITLKILPDLRYQHQPSTEYFLNRYGEDSAVRIAQKMMRTSGELYRMSRE